MKRQARVPNMTASIRHPVSSSSAASASTSSPQSASRPDDSSRKRPQRQTLWQSIRRNLHVRCLCLTILIAICMAIIFWCQLASIGQILVGLQIFDERLLDLTRDSACDDGIVLLPIVCLIMLYIAYVVECWHSTTRLILLYRSDCDSVYSYIEQMKQAQPIIWWKAVCYHHVRHLRPIARYRNNGGPYTTSSHLYHERINTHASGSYFSYSGCGVKDISKELIDLELYPTTRIFFSKGFAFANERSAREFDQQRSHFFRSNEQYDHYLEIREGLDLVGVNFQEYMISTGNRKHTPWYNSRLAFWIFSLALLSWPLRILLEYNTTYVNYQIVKLFGVNYCSANDSHYPLSRATTIDTMSNYMIAPSYSEAMLAERIYCLRSCSNSFDETAAQPKQKAKPVGHNHSQQQQHRLVAPIAEESVSQSCVYSPPLDDPPPPTYDEVVVEANTRDRFKSCIQNICSRLQSGRLGQGNKIRRSLTDKDFFHQLLTTTPFARRPWNSFGDIQNNLISNV